MLSGPAIYLFKECIDLKLHCVVRLFFQLGELLLCDFKLSVIGWHPVHSALMELAYVCCDPPAVETEVKQGIHAYTHTHAHTHTHTHTHREIHELTNDPVWFTGKLEAKN